MECSICLDEFDEINTNESTGLLNSKKYKNVVELECGHIFHKKCINKWIKKNNHCPYCRKYFKSIFRCYVTTPNNTLGKLAFINITDDNPKEIPIKFFNLIFKNKNTDLDIIFTRFNIISVEYNYKNTISVRYFKTLHDEEAKLDLYIFKKEDTNHIYESFIKVLKNHYVSKSKITIDIVEEDEDIQNFNNLTNDKQLIPNVQNIIKIISRDSSKSSILSVDDTTILDEMILAPVKTY